MPVDVFALIALIYEAGNVVVNQCKVVKQCPAEAACIAIRTQNVLGLLQAAAEEFEGNVALETSLLELRAVLQRVIKLVERCKQKARFSAKVLRVFRMRATREALIVAEEDLERVTHDLRLPMLADIRRQLSEIKDQVIQHTPSQTRTALAAVDIVALEDVDQGQEQSVAAAAAAAAAAVDEEADRLDSVDKALMQKARDAIDRGIMARNETGSTVGEVISSQLAKSRGGSCSEGSSDAAAATSGVKPGEGGGTGDYDNAPAGSPIAHIRRALYKNLSQGRPLGHGTFGIVYAGKYNDRDVAIKKARAPIGAKPTLQDFWNEGRMYLAMRHDNIVDVIAFDIGDSVNHPCVIMELMENSVFEMLALEIPINFTWALGIINDVCVALDFLHSYNIIHGDIKSLSVLVDAGGTAKLSDFGLGLLSDSIGNGTLRFHSKKVGSEFMAPELHAHHRRITASSDIFSLHVVMWEVIMNQVLLRAPKASLSLEGAEGPPLLIECLQHLLDRCGSANDRDRPTMKLITPEIKGICWAAQSGGGDGEAKKRETEGERDSGGNASPQPQEEAKQGTSRPAVFVEPDL